ncbi:MAG: hypothetical protein KAS39_00740 [Actinomycetia bacterium]|nr:hypothetical protein [Actinomycetes bacterium]
MTRITNYNDRGTCILFGDGAGAVVLSPSTTKRGIIDSLINCKGKYGHLLQIPAGGSKKAVDEDVIKNSEDKMYMDGKRVFKHAVTFMSDHIKKLLVNNGLEKKDISMYIGHQANARITEAIAATLRVKNEKLPSNIAYYGNTSAASIPILLAELVRDKKLKTGEYVILTAFGAGFVWGSLLIKW